jgi:hypothetical protein
MIRASGLALVILAALSTLLAAQAQQAGSIHRIGWLGLNSPPNPFYDAFARGLRDLGYVEGRNVVVDRILKGAKASDLFAQTSRIYRAAILGPFSTPEGLAYRGAFLAGMRELGYAEGRTAIFDVRTSDRDRTQGARARGGAHRPNATRSGQRWERRARSERRPPPFRSS